MLEKTDFFSDVNRTVFVAINKLRANGDPIDLVTVARQLELDGRLEKIGGPAVLMEITDHVPTAAGVEFYARALRQMAIQRELIQAAGRIIDNAYETPDPNSMLTNAMEQIRKIREDRSGQGHITAKEATQRAVQAIQAANASIDGITGLRTGIEELDQLTFGLHPGEITAIAGRPGDGKSALGGQIALKAALDGFPTLFASYEMLAYRVHLRLMSQLSGVPLSTLRTGKLNEHYWNLLTEATERINDSALFYHDDAGGRQVSDLRRSAQSIQGLRLLVVDYLTLMRPPSGFEHRLKAEYVEENANRLKAMAKEMEISIVILCQLNRSATGRDDKRPILSDLRDSGGIEQAVDICLMLYPNDKDHCTELLIRKNRDSATGMIPLYFDKTHVQFVERAMERPF
jgi:replicative DNA helicase